MKLFNIIHARFALFVAMLAASLPMAAQANGTLLGPTPLDGDVLAQVRALYGLDEQGAIDRLAAEEAAAGLYRRVRTMNLSGYAGAWFDADSGKLHVALSDAAQAEFLARLGAVPVAVSWSLRELEELQSNIVKDAELMQSGLLRDLHVDYALNRLAVEAVPEGMQEVRERLAHYADRIDIREAGEIPELSTDVRGGDGTRNYTFEVDPTGDGYYPCSVGAAVENGYYTAGHCGRDGNDIRWAATYASLGTVQISAYPSSDHLQGDVAWVSTISGWTPVSKVNGYSAGTINVSAKWAGTNEFPVGASVCRYGQVSGGPHCGTVNAKAQHKLLT